MPILSKDNKIGIKREKTIELYSINSVIHIDLIFGQQSKNQTN